MSTGCNTGCNTGENTGSSGRRSVPPIEGFVISSVSGTLTTGSTVTINGGGFGTKATAAPLAWKDFEEGSSRVFLAGPGSKR
jgi:hypothetical protein